VSVLTAAPWRRAPLLLLRGNSAVQAALLFAALRQTAHDAGAACLVATYDPEAIRYADRVLHLTDGAFGERGQ
jgi:ABC-type lipoprotein export system ATPase subunit